MLSKRNVTNQPTTEDHLVSARRVVLAEVVFPTPSNVVLSKHADRR